MAKHHKCFWTLETVFPAWFQCPTGSSKDKGLLPLHYFQGFPCPKNLRSRSIPTPPVTDSLLNAAQLLKRGTRLGYFITEAKNLLMTWGTSVELCIDRWFNCIQIAPFARCWYIYARVRFLEQVYQELDMIFTEMLFSVSETFLVQITELPTIFQLMMVVFRFISGKSRFQIQVCYVIVCEAKSKFEWMQFIQTRYLFLLDFDPDSSGQSTWSFNFFVVSAMSYEWSYAPTNRAKCKAQPLTKSPPFVGYGWLMKNLKVLLNGE